MALTGRLYKGGINSSAGDSGGLLRASPYYSGMDTLGIEPRASRMLSGCDTTTPRALEEYRHAQNMNLC